MLYLLKRPQSFEIHLVREQQTFCEELDGNMLWELELRCATGTRDLLAAQVHLLGHHELNSQTIVGHHGCLTHLLVNHQQASKPNESMKKKNMKNLTLVNNHPTVLPIAYIESNHKSQKKN